MGCKMDDKNCSHLWEMINFSQGLIVIKKCSHCEKVSACFSPDSTPPVEACREEEHFWNFMEADPAFHFDLKCSKCDTIVELNELVGLMVCTGCDEACDEACEVHICRHKLEAENKQVYIALGRRPIDERKQLPEEKLAVLQEYFDQQADCGKPKAKIVSHKMVKNIATCYAVPLNTERNRWR